MKKFTLLFLMLPNLFFANDLSSDEDFEFTVVKNTKALLLNSLTAKAGLSIELFQLKGNSKYKVNGGEDYFLITPCTFLTTPIDNCWEIEYFNELDISNWGSSIEVRK